MKKIHILIVLLVFNLQHLFCQWDGNPTTVNNVIVKAVTGDNNVMMVSDGAGGAIAAWNGYNETTFEYSIQMQRKTSVGGIAWQTAENPIVLVTEPDHYLEISDIESDGMGGAYITWVRYLTDSTSDIHLQYINMSGTKVFGASGIKLNPNNGHLFSSAKLSVTSTGCIVCWADELDAYNLNTPLFAQVFVQRFNTAGAPQWTAGGVPVSAVSSLRALPEVISDGSNGIFVSFVDTRNSELDTTGSFENIDIYAQHISSNGSRLWGATDALVTSAPNNQISLNTSRNYGYMITDNAGGFILLFEDYKTGINNPGFLYAQRINGNGNRLWTNEGVAIMNSSTDEREDVNMAYDGANGMVVSWRQTNLSTFSGTVYAQRVSGAGAIVWTAGGKLISAANTPGLNTNCMAADGAGNFIFNWTTTDSVNFLTVLKGQKVNVNGQLLWAADGVDICANPDASPFNPYIIRSSGTNQMISAWSDFRNGTETRTDIYCAKIGTNGVLIGTINTNYVSNGSGNWSNAATWVSNMVPPVGADVIIRHNIIIDINTICNSLRVETPGVITVNTGVALTVLR